MDDYSSKIVASWFGKTLKYVIVLFGERGSGINELLEHVLKIKEKEKQAIIIDSQRNWKTENYDERTLFVQPSTKEALIEQLISLNSLKTPRLGLIIVDGLPYFFRDYQGKTAKDAMYNNRLYAYSLSTLSNLAKNNDLMVIVSSFSSGMDLKRPVMGEINQYYRAVEYLVINGNIQSPL